MSKSLFQAEHTAEIVRRIQFLKGDARARWGKMDVAQMLAHCQVPLEIATGRRRMNRSLIGRLFGKLAKRKLAGPEPFKRGLPTAPEFVVRDRRDFAAEREKLVALVQTFQHRGPQALSSEHPFFGPMTAAEWDGLQWKHLDHHLRQYGV